MHSSGQLLAGTSGLVLAEANKKSFPEVFQSVSRLEYYASLHNSIEINSSFYKIPRCKTYSTWASLVPDHFRFTVKLWKGITHAKEGYDGGEFRRFMEAIDCLGNRKGCLLIQFPKSTPVDMEQLHQLLSSIKPWDPDNTWRIAVEFRHPGWYNDSVCELLDGHQAAMVQHDMPSSIPSVFTEKTSFVYLRYHGEKGDYRGSYSENFLQEQALHIQQWMKQGKDVYAYFNNTMGDAVANLQMLKKMVFNEQ